MGECIITNIRVFCNEISEVVLSGNLGIVKGESVFKFVSVYPPYTIYHCGPNDHASYRLSFDLDKTRTTMYEMNFAGVVQPDEVYRFVRAFC